MMKKYFIALAITCLSLTACSHVNKEGLNAKVASAPSITSLSMESSTDGWAIRNNPDPDTKVSLGTVLRTSDSGKTWIDVTPKEAINQAHLSGWEFEENNAWIVIGSNIFVSSNAGSNWSSYVLPNKGVATRLSFQKNEGWILNTLGVGVGSKQTELYNSHDGGKTWGSNVLPIMESGFEPNDIAFSSSSIGSLVGSSNSVTGRAILEVTIDKGETWKEQSVPLPKDLSKDQASTLRPFIFSGGKEILPVLVQPDSKMIFYLSIDGGNSWNVSGVLPSSTDCYFINTSIGWAWNPEGILYRTENSGEEWSEIKLKKPLFNIQFINEKEGWGLSEDGRLYRSKDGGNTWIE